MKRLYIISNRLPLTIEHKEGNYNNRQSSGGLVSAVSAFLGQQGKTAFDETIWVGAPGCSQSVWEHAERSFEQSAYKYLPVFIDGKSFDHYYNGFSNSIVWPLFHYFPSLADYHLSYFDAYMEVNRLFADVVTKQIRKEDVVWIHDYHLLPLAGILRKMNPGITVGFFLHIPFPSYELFRVLPKQWQREILSGMLGADLIGFHTVDYGSHFMTCVETILGADVDGQYILWDNRQIKAEAFPIGIDFDHFHHAYDKPAIVKLRTEYTAWKEDKKLLFSVDRLDYTKGILNRLQSYKLFLKNNPDYSGKIIFILVIVPSRDSINEYAERKKIIDEYVGNINSSLGTISWKPVNYQYRHLSSEELISLYAVCDVALITPIRDGMNLVAKEFVASRKDRRGVLILSEMTGAARELRDALLINPNDTKEIAEKIKYALSMNVDEQESRMAAMQERIRKYDVHAWARDYFRELGAVKKFQLEFEVKFLDNLSRINLMNGYSTAGKRLLLLDYDGSLVPFAKKPSEAAPGNELLETLQQLCVSARNDVYIVSGRDGKILETWFGHLNIGLIAEHGAKVRLVNGQWSDEKLRNKLEWMTDAEQLMEKYVAKLPRSFVEKKEFSIAWHYRDAEIIQGGIRSGELYDELLQFASNNALNVLYGNKVLEIRIKGVNKGAAIEKLIKKEEYDFILAIGDDETDEDMFKILARLPQSFTIKVGGDASFAKYNLHTSYMVNSLLQTISRYSVKSRNPQVK